nr:unnamed protein product [Callosobruchus chinensis]
MKAEIEQ